MVRPIWQLPPGTSRESWDYLQSEKIAHDYEEFLGDNPLMELDLRILGDRANQILEASRDRHGPLSILDLGGGTGRVGQSLKEFDVQVVNVDLSTSMLEHCKLLHGNPNSFAEIRGNMAELSFLKPECFDLAVCLFSSLGMIRPRDQRVKCLQQTRTALKPGGEIFLHVHNRYQSLRDPGGIWWLTSSYIASLMGRSEFGDRVYPYRGLPRMFLHIYGRRELVADLKLAGFDAIEILDIQTSGEGLLPPNIWGKNLRAGGFFAVAAK